MNFKMNESIFLAFDPASIVFNKLEFQKLLTE